MFSQKFIFIFIFEYPLRIISELIKILVDTLIEYYTDDHDVDEDRMAIPIYGGKWYEGTAPGITHRNMNDTLTTTHDGVASSNMENSQIIRICTMPTKIG